MFLDWLSSHLIQLVWFSCACPSYQEYKNGLRCFCRLSFNTELSYIDDKIKIALRKEKFSPFSKWKGVDSFI